MAQPIGSKSKLTRPPIKPRRQFLAEATASAEAAGEILTARYGPQQWIEQVCDAVRLAVQNGIENLSGTSINGNAHPGDGYRFRARTKEELLASQALVANQREVGREEEPDDPAAQLDANRTPAPAQRTQPPKAKPGEWLI